MSVVSSWSSACVAAGGAVLWLELRFRCVVLALAVTASSHGGIVTAKLYRKVVVV